MTVDDEDLRQRLNDHHPVQNIVEDLNINRDLFYEQFNKLAKYDDNRLHKTKGPPDLALEAQVYLENMAFILKSTKELIEILKENNTRDDYKIMLEALKFMKEAEQDRIAYKIQVIWSISEMRRLAKLKTPGPQNPPIFKPSGTAGLG